jgi:hypothetical protein
MSALSDKILSITIEYIGPASERFLERQSVNHLNIKSFSEIERKHIQELMKWTKISAGLLIGEVKAQELCNRLNQV